MLFAAIAFTISFRQPAIEKFCCHPKIQSLSRWWAWAFSDETMPESTKNWNNRGNRFDW